VDPAAAEETYQAAMTQFNRGSVNTARRAFESLLADYPDHRRAPSSQFFLADILEQENRLDEAIEGFLRVAELYPTADRVPQALYRIGAIYELQGNLDQAIIYLERVVNTYPDSGVGDLARELLREIR
jgi:tol-pal system protein YbgF